MSLDPLLSHIEANGEIPPIERWSPDFCGDMDLTIRSDGVWVHEGTPIGRPRLVRLLSTVLRRESDGDYYLVTPVEKMRICVEDRPFLVVDAESSNESGATVWWLVTNVGDRVRLDDERRLTISMTPHGEPVPEVAVRFGLNARMNRNVFYRLVELADQHQQGAGIELGLTSGGSWQPLGRIDTELL